MHSWLSAAVAVGRLSGISGRLWLRLCRGLEWIKKLKWRYEYQELIQKLTQKQKGLTHLEGPTQISEMTRLPDANLNAMALIIPDSCT